MDNLIHPLKSIFDSRSEVLILGSFPSVISRKQNFYYANPTNRFWKVMSIVFEEEIIDREQFLLKHHIALWDVIYSCRIQGSSDASIKDVKVNDIESILNKSSIHTIFTTGKKAEMLYQKYVDLDIECICLPSTSSANARMNLDALVEQYKQVKERIYE